MFPVLFLGLCIIANALIDTGELLLTVIYHAIHTCSKLQRRLPDADVAEVAEAIVGVVDMPFGKRPFRVNIDPASEGR